MQGKLNETLVHPHMIYISTLDQRIDENGWCFVIVIKIQKHIFIEQKSNLSVQCNTVKWWVDILPGSVRAFFNRSLVACKQINIKLIF
jgi:hypothetical protein